MAVEELINTKPGLTANQGFIPLVDNVSNANS